MSWDFCTTTIQVAKKDYGCDAVCWIDDSTEYLRGELSISELRSIARAKKDGWKIKKGMKYIKSVGKWEGRFEVFRARIDLSEICITHDLYGKY